MNLCTALNMSLFRSYENHLYSCNTKSILFLVNMPAWILIRPILS